MKDNAWWYALRLCVASAPPDSPLRLPGQPGARSTHRAIATVDEIFGSSHTERLHLGSWVDFFFSQDKVQRSSVPARYVASEAQLESISRQKGGRCRH